MRIDETSLGQMMDILNCRIGHTKFKLRKMENGYSLDYGDKGLIGSLNPKEMDAVIMAFANFLHYRYLQSGQKEVLN